MPPTPSLPSACADTNPACMPPCRIGVTARLSGIAAANIRFYEQEGLLHPPGRSDNRYRVYTPADIHRLRLIRLCRAMDMSLDEVRTLLNIDALDSRSQHQACATLDAHLAHVRARLYELHALEERLQALRQRCDGTHCQVIETLHADAERQAPGNLSTTAPARPSRRPGRVPRHV